MDIRFIIIYPKNWTKGRPRNKTTKLTCTAFGLVIDRLLESYKRMSEPALQVVDASGTPTEVFEAVLKLLKDKLKL